MKKFLTALLILVLLGGAVGAMWHFTDGFKDWSFKKKPNEPIIAEKHIAKTIIENETYGTFELPKHYLKTSNLGAVFANGTDVSFLVEETINFYSTLGVELGYNAAKIGFEGGFFQYIVESEQSGVEGIYVVKNNIICYRNDYTPGNMLWYSFVIFDEITKQSEQVAFYAYVKEGEYYDGENNITTFAPEVIISDSGVPLLDGIYKKLMEDPTTKITYVYNDGIEAPTLPNLEPQEILKTVIQSEKYGTFEIVGDYKNIKMTSAQNVVFPNRTKLSYMLPEAIELINKINGTSYTSDNVKIGFIGNSNITNIGIATHNRVAEIDGKIIYEFATPDVIYLDSGAMLQLQREAEMQIVFVDQENSKYYSFANNVYVEDYVYLNEEEETKVLPKLILSDSKVPLTESIYNEIMADQTTKITYVYKG